MPQLINKFSLKPATVAPVLVVFGLIGAIVLIRSFAAIGNVLAFEAEQGTPSGAIAFVADATASGGMHAVFRPTTATPAPPPAPLGTVVNAESFGAKGDGTTDDTVALQKAFDSLDATKTLLLAAGKSYRHTAVIKLTKAGSHVSGSGTLLATTPAHSAVWINANNVTLDGDLVLKAVNQTVRLGTWEDHKLVTFDVSGTVLRKITIDGSAAAGIFMDGSSNYLIEDAVVNNTLADGIHNTGGAHDGIIRRPVVTGVGDDSVAIVSYGGDGSIPICHHITVEAPKSYNPVKNGRGFTVVGGQDITFTDIYTEGSLQAGLYVGSESNYGTWPARRVKFSGGEIKRANLAYATVDHSAIFVLSQHPQPTEDITFENIKITDTPTQVAQMRLINYQGGIHRVEFKGITITGANNWFFAHYQVAASDWKISNWTYNGVKQADQIGY